MVGMQVCISISLCHVTLILNTIYCRFLPNNPHTSGHFTSVTYTGNIIFSLSITWDVWVHNNNNAVSAEYSGAVDTCILNIERDGGILFSWKVSPQWQRLMISVSYAEYIHGVRTAILILIHSVLFPVWLCCSLHWYHIFFTCWIYV